MNTPLELSPLAKLICAGFLGFAAGFILMKSDLIWRRTVYGIFLLKDGRLIKTILLYLMLGCIGFFLLRRMNLAEVHVVEGFFWSSLIGGMLAGVGMVLSGFTPTGAICAFGCGRLYALWTLAGMLIAIPFVKYANSFLSATIYSWGDAKLSVIEPRSFLAPANPALYIVLISAFLIFLVHFTVGEND